MRATPRRRTPLKHKQQLRRTPAAIITGGPMLLFSAEPLPVSSSLRRIITITILAATPAAVSARPVNSFVTFLITIWPGGLGRKVMFYLEGLIQKEIKSNAGQKYIS